MPKTVILFEMIADRTSKGKKWKPRNKKIVKLCEAKKKLLTDSDKGSYYNQEEWFEEYYNGNSHKWTLTLMSLLFL